MKFKRFWPTVTRHRSGLVHIFDPLYRLNFYAVAGTSHERFRAIMKAEIKHQFEPCTSQGHFYVIERGAKKKRQEIGVIWSNDDTFHLMHECLHATFWAMRSRGMVLSFDSEEAFTYYQGWLHETCSGRPR